MVQWITSQIASDCYPGLDRTSPVVDTTGSSPTDCVPAGHVGVGNHSLPIRRDVQVIVEPDNHELIANQAISFLLADRIATAVRMSPQDKVNRHIERLVDRVVSWQRERPRTLQEAMRPEPSRNLNQRTRDKRPWWSRCPHFGYQNCLTTSRTAPPATAARSDTPAPPTPADPGSRSSCHARPRSSRWW